MAKKRRVILDTFDNETLITFLIIANNNLNLSTLQQRVARDCIDNSYNVCYNSPRKSIKKILGHNKILDQCFFPYQQLKEDIFLKQQEDGSH